MKKFAYAFVTFLFLSAILGSLLNREKPTTKSNQPGLQQQLEDSQKQVAELQQQLNAKQEASAKRPVNQTSAESEVEKAQQQAIEGVIKNGGEIYFGKDTTKAYMDGEAKNKSLVEQARLAIVNTKKQQDELDKAKIAQYKAEDRVDYYREQVEIIETNLENARKMMLQCDTIDSAEAKASRRKDIRQYEKKLKDTKDELMKSESQLAKNAN